MTDSEPSLNGRTSNHGVESEPQASPSGVRNWSDDGINTGYGEDFDNHPGSPVASEEHDMGDDPEMPQNGDPHPELPDLMGSMLDRPLLVEPLRSTPPGDPVNETDDRDPEQPLPTVESPGYAVLKPDGTRPEPLQLRPLNSRRPSRTIKSIGPHNMPVRW
ncbi:hypothetical protein FPANT_10288 [Fusarium pseudoanthophilum]|uniref:Uncharacterized protein n=1 Tax=Fusarium pseudoanthophilum TaxID=48495 RepID=A0A8H5KTI1_9HYPO|nr:hypothetical protein FPANT_10288 [Fusarium pseudoanthophilum]